MYIAHISTHTTSTMYIEVMNQIMRHFRQLSKYLRGLYLLIHANFYLFLASKLIAHKKTEVESSDGFLGKIMNILRSFSQNRYKNSSKWSVLSQ